MFLSSNYTRSLFFKQSVTQKSEPGMFLYIDGHLDMWQKYAWKIVDVVLP